MEVMGLKNATCDWMKYLDGYKGKKVFVTGFTGFKGSWMCRILKLLGADVTGYALLPEDECSIYNIAGIEKDVMPIIADIRNAQKLESVLQEVKPDIVFHLAAQPLVIESYKRPRDTYEINVMGTVNLLDSIRRCDSVKSVVNITTDKVYENKEWVWGYRENEPLNGYDPYSNSKSCSELVTSSYVNSFLNELGIAVSTVRAGNVIGGGDFSENRIIPDCIKATIEKKKIIVRNPYSTRPFQHVIEPLMAYLLIGIRQMTDKNLCGAYNVGPDDSSCVRTGELVDIFCNKWGDGAGWIDNSGNNVCHEANFLKLDSGKLKSTFCWEPRWNIEEAVYETVYWTKEWIKGADMKEVCDAQIKKYMEMSR